MTDQAQLLIVQAHDTHADQIRHRLATLPEAQRVDDLEAELATIEARRTEATARQHDLQRDQKRREDELATLEEKIAKVEAAMYGSSSAGRELQAMGDEVTAMRGRASVIEDAVLEILDGLEPVQADLDALASEAARVEEERDGARVLLTAAEAELTVELEQVMAERGKAAEGLPESLLTEYEAIRKRLGGVGAAALTGNRCDGCHLTMGSAEVEQIKKAAPDEVVHCEECGRILLR